MSIAALLLLASCGVALLSWCAVWVTRELAVRWNIVDTPNERSSHALPVPLCGGIGLVVINLAVWIVFAFSHQGVTLRHAIVIIVGATLIAGISLIDDLGHVPYGYRLLAQGSAALIFIVGYGAFQAVTLPVLGTISLGVVGVVLSLLWIVGLTNAYNFMDGIDGMVGGQTVAAGLGWVALGALTHHLLLAGLGAVLAASSLGFLGHNWYPARIFLGDVGATFLGYTLAAITIVAAHSDPRLALAGVLLVWPSIFDTGFTVFRRLQRGDNIFAGHRSFLFHRLIHVGWSHAAASSFYIPLPILGALLAATWEKGSRPVHAATVVAIIAACYALWALVRNQEIQSATSSMVALALAEGAEPAQRERDTQSSLAS
jgi:UDP-GlcNAc:undecaprenyl-phosphate/decaprenyl-phosphate GlcNAc-1-phosphate transferase